MNISRFRAALRQGVSPGMLHWATRLNDLGKGDALAAPDYTPVANASKESAETMAALGREQIAETKRQYDKNMEVAKPVVDSQLGIMRQTADQGADYYDYSTKTFRPVEQEIVKNAQDFSQAGAKEQFARRAAADLEAQQANEATQAERSATALGVNPNSGRFAGLKRAETITNAAARAGAESNARVQADALATAKKMDAAGLGRNLPGASAGAYSVATGAGNSAVDNQVKPGALLASGMATGAGITGQGLAMQQQGLTNIAAMQSSNYNASLTNSGSDIGGIGSLLGGGAAAYKVFAASSKDFKTNKRPLSIDRVVHGLQRVPVEAWSYKDDMGDGGEHIGPYAEDVRREFGDRVAPEGRAIDLVSMNGIALVGVKSAADRLDRIERKLGLERVPVQDNKD